MMLYWANFIHKSNPNYNKNPANWNVYRNSVDDDFVLDINPQMRNHYYNPTCSSFWDRYAVTNSAFTPQNEIYFDVIIRVLRDRLFRVPNPECSVPKNF
jgi:hypothetical protein